MAFVQPNKVHYFTPTFVGPNFFWTHTFICFFVFNLNETTKPIFLSLTQLKPTYFLFSNPNFVFMRRVSPFPSCPSPSSCPCASSSPCPPHWCLVYCFWYRRNKIVFHFITIYNGITCLKRKTWPLGGGGHNDLPDFIIACVLLWDFIFHLRPLSPSLLPQQW